MFELSDVQTESAAGGFSWGAVVTVGKLGWEALKSYESVMSGIGGTLNNYYGPDGTIEIVAAGNMTA